METMQGRVAVVTGAASGIGKALSLAFAAEGAKVVLADVENAALDATRKEIEAIGAPVLAVVAAAKIPLIVVIARVLAVLIGFLGLWA